jgi:hypothetical protein
MRSPQVGTCRVSIVMTARERHSLTEAAIESVLSETSRPFRFIYLDVNSPEWLRDVFAARASEWDLEVMRVDEPLWPQEARVRFAGQLDTEFVVFIDNDVQVEPGWLDAMIRCADETGAGIVGPLYLLGDGVTAPSIHMAGGQLVQVSVDDGIILEESHLLAGADPRKLAPLARQPCDYLEFHCMMIRADLLREPSILDARLRCVHEHIDVALSAKQRGYPVFLEPASRITYLGFADYMLDELAFFRGRWSPPIAEADIATFCAKWNVLDDVRAFGGVRSFLHQHAAQVDPIRGEWLSRTEMTLPMRREELPNTRSELLDLATQWGYKPVELVRIAQAYKVAHVLVDGGYRPCGRPFIDHLVGTAGVLIRYCFRVEAVVAGLLHAAYTHSPPHPGGAEASLTAVRALLGGNGSAVETRVRRYTLDDSATAGTPRFAAPISTLSVADAELVAMRAANELEMHLSGEFRYSGRTDGMSSADLARTEAVCKLLGVPGLYGSLQAALQCRVAPDARFVTRIQASYRIGTDRNSAVPMLVNGLGSLRA